MRAPVVPLLAGLACLASLSCTGGPQAAARPEAAPVVSALEATWPAPRNARVVLVPGEKRAPSVRLEPTGHGGSSVRVVAHFVLDVTSLVEEATDRNYEQTFGGQDLQKVGLAVTEHYLGHLVASGLAGEDAKARWKRRFTAIEVSIDGLRIDSPPPRDSGQMSRVLTTSTAHLVVVSAVRPDGFTGTPGPGMLAGGRVLADVHVLASGGGFAEP